MSKNTFYRSKKETAITYLEFGSIDLLLGKKNVWDFKLHDKAYDWLMLSRYANDLLTYMKMKELIDKKNIEDIINLYEKEIHHKSDLSNNIGKLCALVVMNNIENRKNSVSFFELGQTIFGCIEGIDFIVNLLKKNKINVPALNLKSMKWLGVDISDLFNRLAVLIHQNYNIRTVNDLKLLRQKADIFFAKGVTLLYVIRSANQMINLLKKGKLCIFDYSFSMKGEQEITLGTGKQIKYIDYKSFYNEHKKNSNGMYVRKSKSNFNDETKRIFIDCIYGEEGLCQEFIKLNKKIRKELSNRLSNINNVSVFLDRTKDESYDWIGIEDFIETIKQN